MKELDPLLHSQLRLAVMSILMNVEEADFVFLKEKPMPPPAISAFRSTSSILPDISLSKRDLPEKDAHRVPHHRARPPGI